MTSDDTHPPRIIGGGINTGDTDQPVVVTQMLGIDNNDPIREEVLRARFLSFDPLFDSASTLVAHQLVLRGRTPAEDAPPELRQMEEDMLLTGLYSLTQDGLTGKLPLLVRISQEVLFSDIPKQLNHSQLLWWVNITNEQQLARALVLQDSGLTFCATYHSDNRIMQDSASAWRFLSCQVDDTPPKVTARLIVEGVRRAENHARWPRQTWFKSSFFSGETPPSSDNTHEQAIQLELLAIALRQSTDTLIQFFRLNPDMTPRLLAIANSQAGGLSRPADSAMHALVMLGPQRASRVAALLALTGARPTEAARHYAVTALTRALFMGKITRLGSPAENAATAFEIGLLSTATHALSVSEEILIRKLQLPATTARALSAHPTAEGTMLQLVYACENNEGDVLAAYAAQLNLPLHQISVAYLDALISASALDAALH